VDKLKFCPSDIEGIDDKLVCSKTKDGKSKVCICRYGDTKEQLIRKVAQVLFKEELGWYAEYPKIIPKGEIDEPFCRNIYEHCLDKATKIVEFLGVE
jgi:hypothetical protein